AVARRQGFRNGPGPSSRRHRPARMSNMKFGICNEIFERWPWERVCEYAAKLGYKGLEVAPFTLGENPSAINQEPRDDVRGCAERHGIEILGLHWLLVVPPGLYITSPDLTVRRKTAQYFQ